MLLPCGPPALRFDRLTFAAGPFRDRRRREHYDDRRRFLWATAITRGDCPLISLCRLPVTCPPHSKAGDPYVERFQIHRAARLLRGGAAVSALALFNRGWLAAEEFTEELLRTPPLTEGPFYPDKLPLDTDNDLIIVNDSITPAVGEITHLTGRVLDAGGNPVKNVTVEIWQCDAKQVYLNTRDSVPKASQRDANFQGFGRFTTGSKGEYRFRTIKPVAYPGRPAPHIHFKVKRGDRELLTTQLFIRGYRRQRPRRRLPRRPRSGRSRIDRHRFQADQGIEDRRAGGEFRHRARPHARRPWREPIATDS